MPGRPLSRRKVPSAPHPNLKAKVLVRRRVPRVSEKVRGKRAAKDEPTQKKMRMVDVAPRKPGGISLGGDRTTQTQSAAMSEWSDNDEAPVAPPPSTRA